jgi:hypothetical protein
VIKSEYGGLNNIGKDLEKKSPNKKGLTKTIGILCKSQKQNMK